MSVCVCCVLRGDKEPLCSQSHYVCAPSDPPMCGRARWQWRACQLLTLAITLALTHSALALDRVFSVPNSIISCLVIQEPCPCLLKLSVWPPAAPSSLPPLPPLPTLPPLPLLPPGVTDGTQTSWRATIGTCGPATPLSVLLS